MGKANQLFDLSVRGIRRLVDMDSETGCRRLLYDKPVTRTCTCWAITMAAQRQLYVTLLYVMPWMTRLWAPHLALPACYQYQLKATLASLKKFFIRERQWWIWRRYFDSER
jgi:hypothetical protein